MKTKSKSLTAGSAFPAGMTFDRQTFPDSCRFGDGSAFTYCTFLGDDTTFGAGCAFTHCTFTGWGTAFGRHCLLTSSTFGQWSTEFGRNCRFAGCTFAECTSFGDHNRFKDCRFPPRVSLGYGCEFEGVNHGLVELLASEKKRVGTMLDEQIAKLLGGVA